MSDKAYYKSIDTFFIEFLKLYISIKDDNFYNIKNKNDIVNKISYSIGCSNYKSLKEYIEYMLNIENIKVYSILDRIRFILIYELDQICSFNKINLDIYGLKSIFNNKFLFSNQYDYFFYDPNNKKKILTLKCMLIDTFCINEEDVLYLNIYKHILDIFFNLILSVKALNYIDLFDGGKYDE